MLGRDGIARVVAMGSAGGLALRRLERRPEGTGSPRQVALVAGIILGGLVGWIAFRAS